VPESRLPRGNREDASVKRIKKEVYLLSQNNGKEVI
jgi:hypothetical protein